MGAGAERDDEITTRHCLKSNPITRNSVSLSLSLSLAPRRQKTSCLLLASYFRSGARGSVRATKSEQEGEFAIERGLFAQLAFLVEKNFASRSGNKRNLMEICIRLGLDVAVI